MAVRSFADGRRRLRDRQLEKLRRLLVRCERNPFYAPRLGASGIKARTLRAIEDLRRLPPVTKEDVLRDQAVAPPFGARLGVRRDEIREVHLTSGTSGLGQEAMALSTADVVASGATWVPTLRAAGLEPGDVFATFYPATVFAYGRSVLNGGRAAGVAVVSMAGLDRTVALDVLRRLQPRAIGARPALFGLLAEDLAAAGSEPGAAFPELRSLIVSGISVTQAATLQERWGAVVHEVYGMSQAAGIIAVTGPEGAAPDGGAGVMRCLEEQFLIEAVHPGTLEPVEEGEAELLLTCLDRIASPILRFRTRDRVEVVAPGAYGDGVSSLGIRVGSVGRFDDMVKIRGNNVWPSQLDGALLALAAVRDYRAAVTVDDRGVDQLAIVVRIDPAAAAARDLAPDLVRRVKAATNVRPVIVFDPDLPAPELKPKRLMDRRRP